MQGNNKRILIQFGFFVLLNAAFFGVPLFIFPLPVLECFSMPSKTVLCNFGILQRNLSFDWAMSPVIPFASIAAFIIVGALVGRAMCGWICPLGFLQDLLARIAQFFKVRQKELPRKVHQMLITVKYMVLFATISIVASVGLTYTINWLLGKKYSLSLGICGHAPYCLICPVPVLFVTIPSILNTIFVGAPLPLLPVTFYIGLTALMALLIFSLILRRFWCRYICPLGALMSLFNKFSLLNIKKKQNGCTTFCSGHKRDCNKICPMQIEVSRKENPSSDLECMLCYECAYACANKALKHKIG